MLADAVLLVVAAMFCRKKPIATGLQGGQYLSQRGIPFIEPRAVVNREEIANLRQMVV